MRSAIIAFVAGVVWLQTLAELPARTYALILLAVGVLVLTLAQLFKARLRSAFTLAGRALAAGLIGFSWAAIIAHSHLSEHLPREWEGRDVTVVGTVANLPYDFEQGVRFHFAVEKVLSPGDERPAVPSRLALSWYASQAAAQVRPGERWQLTVRLRRPHGNANPHGFDYEAWLIEQNLRATGYVRPDEQSKIKNKRQDAFVFSVPAAIARARGALHERIKTSLEGRQYAGVIAALVIGEQRAISQSDWKVFNRTGTGHLISISGLHITMIAGFFAFLAFQVWRRSFFTGAQLPLLLPAQKAAAIAGVLAAVVYVALAGFGVPAQRTLYMLIVVALALWFDRIASISHVLCLALGIVVLIDPWAVLWPGFWLSFGAVAIILYATTGRALPLDETRSHRFRWISTLKSASITQYAVTIGLVPLSMLLFGQVSLVSPIANAIAIPLISFVVTPISLLGSVFPAPLSDWLLSAAHGTAAGLAGLLEWLSTFSWAVWSAPSPSWWIFICALLGTVWLLAPRGWPVRWLGVAGWLPLILNVPATPGQGEVWVTAFDVGQGTAILVETANHRLLYDTGPSYSVESDGGTRIIVPYLRGRGIHRLDTMVVSHGDNDHAGGALSVLDEVKVDHVSSSLSKEHPIAQKSAQYQRCSAGQGWQWDGIRFDMLHPALENYGNPKAKTNALSCTLRITTGAHAILLPGDIEAAQENDLLKHQPQNLKSTVLFAPHHGSGTSSTVDFLKTVQPELALFQVGYRNRYQHPKREVFDRYGELGIKRLRTDDSGAITLRFSKSIEVREYRTDHARYWYAK